MWAQSLFEYGAVSVLVEAFTNLWVGFRDLIAGTNPIWYAIGIVLLVLFLRRK